MNFNLPLQPAPPPTLMERFHYWLAMQKFNHAVWAGYYKADGEPLRCTNCDSWHDSDHEVLIYDTINGHASEYSIHCRLCGSYMGYWAYGYWEPPFRL